MSTPPLPPPHEVVEKLSYPKEAGLASRGRRANLSTATRAEVVSSTWAVRVDKDSNLKYCRGFECWGTGEGLAVDATVTSSRTSSIDAARVM